MINLRPDQLSKVSIIALDLYLNFAVLIIRRVQCINWINIAILFWFIMVFWRILVIWAIYQLLNIFNIRNQLTSEKLKVEFILTLLVQVECINSEIESKPLSFIKAQFIINQLFGLEGSEFNPVLFFAVCFGPILNIVNLFRLMKQLLSCNDRFLWSLLYLFFTNIAHIPDNLLLGLLENSHFITHQRDVFYRYPVISHDSLIRRLLMKFIHNLITFFNCS